MSEHEEDNKKVNIKVKANLLENDKMDDEHKHCEIVLDTHDLVIRDLKDLENFELPLVLKINSNHKNGDENTSRHDPSAHSDESSDCKRPTTNTAFTSLNMTQNMKYSASNVHESKSKSKDQLPKRTIGHVSIQDHPHASDYIYDNTSTGISSIFESNILDEHMGYIPVKDVSTPNMSQFYDPNGDDKGRYKRFLFKIPPIPLGDENKKVIRTKITFNLKNLLKNSTFCESDDICRKFHNFSGSDVEEIKKGGSKHGVASFDYFADDDEPSKNDTESVNQTKMTYEDLEKFNEDVKSAQENDKENTISSKQQINMEVIENSTNSLENYEKSCSEIRDVSVASSSVSIVDATCHDSSEHTQTKSTQSVTSSFVRLEEAIETSLKNIVEQSYNSISLDSVQKKTSPDIEQKRLSDSFSKSPNKFDVTIPNISEQVDDFDKHFIESVIQVALIWKKLKEILVAQRQNTGQKENEALTEHELVIAFAAIVNQIIGMPNELKTILSKNSQESKVSTDTLTGSKSSSEEYISARSTLSYLENFAKQLDEAIEQEKKTGSQHSARRKSSIYESRLNLHDLSEDSTDHSKKGKKYQYNLMSGEELLFVGKSVADLLKSNLSVLKKSKESENVEIGNGRKSSGIVAQTYSNEETIQATEPKIGKNYQYNLMSGEDLLFVAKSIADMLQSSGSAVRSSTDLNKSSENLTIQQNPEYKSTEKLNDEQPSKEQVPLSEPRRVKKYQYNLMSGEDLFFVAKSVADVLKSRLSVVDSSEKDVNIPSTEQNTDQNGSEGIDLKQSSAEQFNKSEPIKGKTYQYNLMSGEDLFFVAKSVADILKSRLSVVSTSENVEQSFENTQHKQVASEKMPEDRKKDSEPKKRKKYQYNLMSGEELLFVVKSIADVLQSTLSIVDTENSDETEEERIRRRSAGQTSYVPQPEESESDKNPDRKRRKIQYRVMSGSDLFIMANSVADMINSNQTLRQSVANLNLRPKRSSLRTSSAIYPPKKVEIRESEARPSSKTDEVSTEEDIPLIERQKSSNEQSQPDLKPSSSKKKKKYQYNLMSGEELLFVAQSIPDMVQSNASMKELDNKNASFKKELSSSPSLNAKPKKIKYTLMSGEELFLLGKSIADLVKSNSSVDGTGIDESNRKDSVKSTLSLNQGHTRKKHSHRRHSEKSAKPQYCLVSGSQLKLLSKSLAEITKLSNEDQQKKIPIEGKNMEKGIQELKHDIQEMKKSIQNLTTSRAGSSATDGNSYEAMEIVKQLEQKLNEIQKRKFDNSKKQ